MKSLFKKSTTLFLVILLTINSFGQTPSIPTIFNRPSITQLQNQTPPTTQNYHPTPFETVQPNMNHNPILGGNSFEKQNAAIRQQMQTNQQANQQTEYKALKQEIKEEERKEALAKYRQQSKLFQNKLQEFLQLNPNNFSITKAVYLSESAWYDNPPTFEQFETAIKQRAHFVKTLLLQEKLNPKNNTAINYAIQKLYTQSNKFYNPKTKQLVTIPKLSYDFNDPGGDKQLSQLFVTKLLTTGKGQCHSMPLLYLCIAEQLGGKAYLSVSPEHSFIQYFDDKNYRYNFETTNGNLVTQVWLMQSNYVNATALKNKTYLDTLSSKQLYAACLADLLNNYADKLGYDNVSDEITNQVLKIDPNNLTALANNANLLTYIAMQKLKAVGNPPKDQIPNYPEANEAYQTMLQSYDRIDQTGYQDMPKDEYQRWLKSVEIEKKKDENKQVQQRMKAEIEMLKKLRTKITFKPKG